MRQPVNVRIDERLIHGQVAALWSKELQLNRIILIDDEVINNPMQKTLQKTACPSTIKLSMISTAKAAANFAIDKYADERSMVIVRWPQTLLSLAQAGVSFAEVVIGNMPNKPGTQMVTKQIFVKDEQKAIFHQLSDQTHFIVQLVPSSTKEDFMAILESAK